MEDPEVESELLKNKYGLHKSREVEIAAKRSLQRSGEKVPQDSLKRIRNYLNRFHDIIERGGPERREHNLDLIKGMFYRKYVIKPDEVPEVYFENQRRLAREQGHGDIDITPQMRSQLTEVIIADQKSGLDKWIDYLSSSDAPYPDAFKYWVLRSVLDMAEYDKERKMYPQRSKGTTKPFPDLNREALAYVLDAISKKYGKQKIDLSHLREAEAKEFEKLLQSENFARLYGFAIEKVTPASQEELLAAKGNWVRYPQGSDYMTLVRSLQGHGTGWCSAGESTAQIQLQGGDFYVYYTLDKSGKLGVPRAAIRMEVGRIAEVRGIAPDQNLDGAVTPIVEEKLREFPDGAAYQKRVSDMQMLTEMEKKVKERLELSAQDLIFLYEVDSPIEGFGYQKDPRIKELRSQRNPEEDMPVVFGCEVNRIARNPRDIREGTKSYVGKLEPGVFNLIARYNIDHVYTKFPEGRVKKEAVEIGGKTAQQLEAELRQANININRYAQAMLRNPDFTTRPSPELLNTVRLTVQDLGFDKGTPTTDQVYKRAAELGLELCPAEVGPHLRLKDTDQPLNEWYAIGMKQITDSRGGPGLFVLGRGEGGRWLSRGWADPGYGWSLDYEVVFSLRKFEPSNPWSLGLLDRLFRR